MYIGRQKTNQLKSNINKKIDQTFIVWNKVTKMTNVIFKKKKK